MEPNSSGSLGLSRRDLLGLAGFTGAALLLGSLAACSSSGSGSAGAAYIASKVDRAAPGDLGRSSLQPFSYRLLDQLGAGNVVLSPFSVAVVLAMIANGAAGETAAEFEALFGSGVDALDSELNSLLQALDRAGHTDTIALTVANSVWAQRDLEFSPAFLDALARYFGAGVNAVDFKTQSAAVVNAINAWAKEKTKGLIPKIVTPDMITQDTRLALANAIHFKGQWASQFEKGLTNDEPFTTEAGKTVQVPMMQQQLGARWLETEAWQGVALAFEGFELAMALVLPKASGPVGLSELMRQTGFDALLDAPMETVQLAMPRWKFRKNAQLADQLKQLGLRLAFDPNAADFSRMTEQERLFLGFIVHEATITVDETGAEAAAVTVGGMTTTSLPAQIYELRLDRPFYWAIAHMPSASLLFTGRVSDPTVAE